MKITIEKKTVDSFHDAGIGKMFIYRNSVYMRIPEIVVNGGSCNAVLIHNSPSIDSPGIGDLAYFYPGNEINLISEVIIRV